MTAQYRKVFEIIDGSARKIIPHITPEVKELMLQRAIRKQMPTPRVVSVTIDTEIAAVDGKATLLIKL